MANRLSSSPNYLSFSNLIIKILNWGRRRNSDAREDFSMHSFLHVLLEVYCFLGLHPRHMEVPRLGVEPELQLLASATVTATQDLSHVCDLQHSSWQCRIVNPLSETRDQTCILTVPGRIRFRCATTRTSLLHPRDHFLEITLGLLLSVSPAHIPIYIIL